MGGAALAADGLSAHRLDGAAILVGGPYPDPKAGPTLGDRARRAASLDVSRAAAPTVADLLNDLDLCDGDRAVDLGPVDGLTSPPSRCWRRSTCSA